ncbi:MAG TPA: tripartite tricarboxylate transporter TctB family protein [Pseudolabrys sp.]|nr:tripartite tricarboxylate transporter TctB family protein [Pseudolabrys sp.]
MTQARPHSRRDFGTGIGLAVLALVIAAAGGLIAPASWLDPAQSPSIYPCAALLGVAVCGLIIAFGKSAQSDAGESLPVNRRSIGMGLIMAAYAILLPFLGLIVSTLALHLALPTVFRYRRWGAAVAFAVIIIGLSWLVFIKVMGIPLKL